MHNLLGFFRVLYCGALMGGRALMKTTKIAGCTITGRREAGGKGRWVFGGYLRYWQP